MSNTPLFATSTDGTRIAYEVSGDGPAIVLLHGSLQNRQSWSKVGYVDRLKSQFKVINIDLRGNGDSDRPIEFDAYAIAKLGQDVLSVADTCAVDTFSVWGYSTGGNIARYLASQSKRIQRLILLGVEFGRGAPDRLRERVVGAIQHWTPIWKSQDDGTLDIQTLSHRDQQILQAGVLRSSIALANAAFEWPVNKPADLLCPTLWLTGTNNVEGMANVEEYRNDLAHSKVTLHVVDGLNHEEELTNIDKVWPIMQVFTEHGTTN